MDDARHAFRVEKYIKLKNIFDYFSEQGFPEKTLNIEGLTIKEGPCHLPLSFERTMQSGLKGTINSESRKKWEKKSPINKKMNTAEDCLLEDFEDIGDKTQNRRIDKLFNKFLKKNIEYLQIHSEDKIKIGMEEFSLTKFEKEIHLNIKMMNILPKKNPVEDSKIDKVKPEINFTLKKEETSDPKTSHHSTAEAGGTEDVVRQLSMLDHAAFFQEESLNSSSQKTTVCRKEAKNHDKNRK